MLSNPEMIPFRWHRCENATWLQIMHCIQDLMGLTIVQLMLITVEYLHFYACIYIYNFKKSGKGVDYQLTKGIER